MPEATHEGTCGTPGEGPYVTMRLKVSSGVAIAARTETNGCASMRTAGAMLCFLATGRETERLARLEPDDLRAVLRLPEGKAHCLATAVTALKAALADTKDGEEIKCQ